MKSKKKLWIRFVIIMAFAVLFLLFALFAGKFAPYDPLETHYTDLLKAPCKQYLMGTDQMGRDIFSWFHFYNCTCKLSWYRTSKSDFGNDHNRMDLLCKN